MHRRSISTSHLMLARITFNSSDKLDQILHAYSSTMLRASNSIPPEDRNWKMANLFLRMDATTQETFSTLDPAPTLCPRRVGVASSKTTCRHSFEDKYILIIEIALSRKAEYRYSKDLKRCTFYKSERLSDRDCDLCIYQIQRR